MRRGRMPSRLANTQQQRKKTTALVAVSYDRATASASHRLIAASEARAGGTFRSEYDFPHLNRTTRVLAVPIAQLAQTEAALRAQPGVRNVALTGGRRYPLAVSTPYYTNDSYFQGFTQSQTGSDPATFQQQPLVENANVPGQWGAHVTQLDYAFEYSQAGNGSNVSNVRALGSSSIKIAIIDTGADLTQPDLAPKVTLQRCYISDPSGAQSTSNFVTDPDGHGTNVSGIAGAASNNGFGFTGEGGASVLYEYRVNPAPDSGCFATPVDSTDNLCGATTTDVAAAINDAVSRGVNVISMSLGGDTCTTPGQDPDPTVEGDAVANAIASNVIVVAAAGNGGTSSDTKVTAPGCDSGVIAVGASALADGQPNGTGNSNGTSVAPSEYVASYSSYGSTTAAFGNPNAWGIVAPGGDPTGSSDQDELHWIDNLYTSMPSDPADDSVVCGTDYANTGPAAECQTLIAGTSMSTPVVAGAAALILAVAPGYHVPSLMKQLLCTTSDDINDLKQGCGRLNIYRAMAVALGDNVLPTAKLRRH